MQKVCKYGRAKTRIFMELKQVLNQTNFEFKKKFGQNFISDTNLLLAICKDANLQATDQVLEIGVGAGTLTKALAQNCKKVVGYEIDTTLQDVLQISLAGVENAAVVFKDFLSADVEEVKSHFSGKFKVVANLPYYVTTDIILRLLQTDFDVESISIMVQKEVAERLVAKCGTKDYGSLTAEIASVADAKITRIVNRNMFNPVPNVDSAIVNIVLNKNKFDIADKIFHTKVIRAAFSMRRKTLANCFKANFGLTSDQLAQLFEQTNLASTIRGESLSAEQFVNISNTLAKIIKTKQ